MAAKNDTGAYPDAYRETTGSVVPRQAVETPDARAAYKSGLYEKAVQWITERVKPGLHNVTQGFVRKSVAQYAPDNPRYARMIEFEVRRRGDGAGLTQDVAEPMLWVGVKTVAALAIAAVTKSLENKKLKPIGYIAALGLVLNNAVDLLRLVPRYTAGLQGSLEMAKDRWEALQNTGVDPFNQQQSTREISHPPEDEGKTSFSQNIARSGRPVQARPFIREPDPSASLLR